MATIGYRSAVIQLPGQLRACGTLAWLGWLALHLVTLLGGRNRITALASLSWRYLAWRSGGGIIGDHAPGGPGPLNEPARPRGTSPVAKEPVKNAAAAGS